MSCCYEVVVIRRDKSDIVMRLGTVKMTMTYETKDFGEYLWGKSIYASALVPTLLGRFPIEEVGNCLRNMDLRIVRTHHELHDLTIRREQIIRTVGILKSRVMGATVSLL